MNISQIKFFSKACIDIKNYNFLLKHKFKMNYVFTFSARTAKHTHYHFPFKQSVPTIPKINECCARNKNLIFY